MLILGMFAMQSLTTKGINLNSCYFHKLKVPARMADFKEHPEL